MELKEFDIMLDIKKSKKIENIEVVQKDYESNIFNISIVEDFKPYNLAELNVEIAFAKSDGTTVLQDANNGVEINDNVIRCTLKTNTIACPGRVYAEVRLLKDTQLLTTARFDFFVRRAIVNDETVKSTNEFPILNKKVQEVDDLIEYVKTLEAVKGDKGDPGDSAYQVWLNQGNAGTVEDYLASLKGEKGPKGDKGLQGEQGIQGDKGDKGDKGDAGTSLKILGNYDTVEELKQAYPNGSDLDGGFMVGLDYYYWGLNGWTSAGQLQGPKGEKGDKGDKGEQGIQGIRGIQGEKGDKGDPGSDANVTSVNITNALGYTPANKDAIGDLATLSTIAKDDVVKAINEVNGKTVDLTPVEGKIDNLAGEGRTTETVKQNYDNISTLQQELDNIKNGMGGLKGNDMIARREILDIKLKLDEMKIVDYLNKTGIGFYDLFTDTSNIDVVNTTATVDIAETDVTFTGTQLLKILSQKFDNIFNTLELSIYDKEREDVTVDNTVSNNNQIQLTVKPDSVVIGDRFYYNGTAYTVTGVVEA